jgi:hypothetical protein
MSARGHAIKVTDHADRFQTTFPIMIETTLRRMPRPQELIRMSAGEMRESFLVQEIYRPGHLPPMP